MSIIREAGVTDYIIVVLTYLIGITLGLTLSWWVYESWTTQLYLSSYWSFFHAMTRVFSLVALAFLIPFWIPILAKRIENAFDSVNYSQQERARLKRTEKSESNPTTF